jgi:biopolymer transport protein ExbD
VAFKRPKKPKESFELVSLIDMIFILLVFFLVTNFVIKMPLQERSLYIPTPKSETGRAQIVIQFIDGNRIFWLDDTVSGLVSEIEENYGYLSPQRLRTRIVSELIRRNTISSGELNSKLDALRKRADEDPYVSYFILIRCPNDLPFARMIDIIAKISDTAYRNIKYGCVGGELEDIRQCKRITTVSELDDKGFQRQNIRIDF